MSGKSSLGEEEMGMVDVGVDRGYFLSEELLAGDYCGEEALHNDSNTLSSNEQRANTVLVRSSNVEFITVKILCFLEMRHRFDKKRLEKIEFIMKCMPFLREINSQRTIENIIRLF